ncbi:hypothetical protein QJQ45_021083 [Haematococcus lacustris]|nr:hypothetical protein QJQ45_021083 [Haematococcus lacustris]
MDLSLYDHKGGQRTQLIHRQQSCHQALTCCVVVVNSQYAQHSGDMWQEGKGRVIDAHFAARQRVRELRRQLEERAVALRSIQKRLLMRFKDKAPAPLNQLDYLMEETYSGLMELGGLLDTAQGQVKQQAGKLSAAVQLLLLLASFKFGLQASELAVLRSALAPEVSDGEDVGWEEATEASLTQLLRSCLARNAKEAAVPLPALAPAKDTSKLKKHLALVLVVLVMVMVVFAVVVLVVVVLVVVVVVLVLVLVVAYTTKPPAWYGCWAWWQVLAAGCWQVLERLSRGQRMVLEGEDVVLGAGTNTSGTAASSLPGAGSLERLERAAWSQR